MCHALRPEDPFFESRQQLLSTLYCCPLFGDKDFLCQTGLWHFPSQRLQEKKQQFIIILSTVIITSLASKQPDVNAQ
jgi:hypothetical protein